VTPCTGAGPKTDAASAAAANTPRARHRRDARAVERALVACSLTLSDSSSKHGRFLSIAAGR
jgi:hypothetical protein